MSPTYGQRLVVNVVDERARSNYSTPFACIPRGTDPRDGFSEISYASLSNAVNKCAWHLDKYLGKSINFDTFAWLAHPLDLRYAIFTLAAMKTGRRAFFTSHRNSLQAHLSLLDQADCHVWLVDEKVDPLVDEIRKARRLKLVKAPTLEQLLSDTEDTAPAYPYHKTFEEARTDPVCVLHTSGSTGIPKIVVCKHTFYTVQDAYRNLPGLVGSKPFTWHHFQGMRALVVFPGYHAAGQLAVLGANVFYDVVNVMAPMRPMTAELIDACHVHAGVELSLLPPSLLKDIATNSEFLGHLDKVKYVGNGGGPLSPDVGAELVKHTHPVNMIGSTEVALLPTEMVDPEDHMYMRFNLSTGIEFRHTSDEEYEMVIKRDDTLQDYQNVFNSFPELTEWPTKDLYKQHPTKPGLWTHIGRNDDIVVFNNGEKLNPATIEQKVVSHPQVKGVIVFGTGRFEAGLLVEPEPLSLGDDREHALREDIWHLLQQVNEETVAHGKVSKDMMVFARSDKPFPRSGKGSIQRRFLLDLYAGEIDDIYAAKESLGASDFSELASDDPATLQKGLQSWIQANTSRDAPAPDDDLFEAGLGFDSLLIMRLSHNINNSNKANLTSPSSIYANPTITGIAESILAYKGGYNSSTKTLTREERMDQMLEKFSQDISIPSQGRARDRSPNQGIVVAVTGTTGTFGSYLLDILIRNKTVSKIYCLNRRENAKTVQHELQKSHALSSDFSKVTFLTIELSREGLGISQEGRQALTEEIDIVVHNAWVVDWNLPLESFGNRHIYGLRQLIDLCIESKKQAGILFISSIATVQEWHPSSDRTDNQGQKQLVPETEHDWTMSSAMGYAESKHVGEHLLAQASRLAQVPVRICRVGQIAGPVEHGVDAGHWPKQEWIPVVIKTSINLKAFPSDLGTMSRAEWIPVDLLGSIVSEIIINSSNASSEKDLLQYFHITNPYSSTWSDILPTIIKASIPHQDHSIISLPDWVATLKKQMEINESTDPHAVETQHEQLPATRLLGFFESEAAAALADPEKRRPKLDTRNAQASSQTLRGLKAVDAEWMALWMRQWRFVEAN